MLGVARVNGSQIITQDQITIILFWNNFFVAGTFVVETNLGPKRRI